MKGTPRVLLLAFTVTPHRRIQMCLHGMSHQQNSEAGLSRFSQKDAIRDRLS